MMGVNEIALILSLPPKNDKMFSDISIYVEMLVFFNEVSISISLFGFSY